MTSNWFPRETRQRNNAELKRGRSSIENMYGESINRFGYGYVREDLHSTPSQKRAKTSRNPSGIHPYNNDVHNSFPVHVGQGYCSNVRNNVRWNLPRVPIGAPVHVASVSSQYPTNPNLRLRDYPFSNLITPLTVQKPMISKDIQNQFDDLPEWQPDNPRLRNPTGLVQYMPSMIPSNSVGLQGSRGDSIRNMNHGNFIDHGALTYPQSATNMVTVVPAPSQKLINNNLNFGIGSLMANSKNSLSERKLNNNNQVPVPLSFPEKKFHDLSQVSPQLKQSFFFPSKDLSDLLSTLRDYKLILPTDDELIQESKQPIESTSELEFDASKLKVRNESVIAALYGDLPRQCTSCGLRFKCQEQHSNHMDWHVKKNRMKSNMSQKQKHLQKLKQSRKWFANASLWLNAATGETLDEKTLAELFNVKNDGKHGKTSEEYVVPADESQTNCALCNEPFEDFFSDEADEWMYKEAVYLNMKKGRKVEITRSMDRSQLGPIVHFKCMPETKNAAAKDLRQHSIPLGRPSTDLLVC